VGIGACVRRDVFLALGVKTHLRLVFPFASARIPRGARGEDRFAVKRCLDVVLISTVHLHPEDH
ncbi:MAG: hypothetical protein AAF752_14055, partial [Bacteroidota bacterium]